MSSPLSQNHFELFSLPEQYRLDRARLAARYRDLQRSVHPDRFASAGDRERLQSVQLAAQINEAFETLKDPLRRGRYLLELRGHSLDDPQATHQDPVFLMQQMELRERLAGVRGENDPLQALDGLAREIRAAYEELETQLAEALDSGSGIDTAVTLVLRMQFFTRLNNEVQELEADLEDELF